MKQIYAILEPGSRRVMYVGASQDARGRVRDHWGHRRAAGRTPVRDWLRQLNADGVLSGPPEYYVFEEVPDSLANEAEQYYTEILRQINPELLNIIDGRKPRAVTLKRISDALTGRFSGRSYPTNTFPHGEDTPQHKLTEQKVKEIRLSAEPTRALAKKYGVSQSMITYVKNRKSWKHVE